MGILDKIKAGIESARKTEGKTKVKGTMSSEVDGRNYTSKGVVRSKQNSFNNTTKTVTKLKGRGYDTPLKSSRQVVVKYNDGTVKRTGGNTKFKKGYEVKPTINALPTKKAEMLPTTKATLQSPAPKSKPTMGYTKKMGQTPMQRKLMLAKEKMKERIITPPKSYISKDGKNVQLSKNMMSGYSKTKKS
jgi:hypothetical protein